MRQSCSRALSHQMRSPTFQLFFIYLFIILWMLVGETWEGISMPIKHLLKRVSLLAESRIKYNFQFTLHDNSKPSYE